MAPLAWRQQTFWCLSDPPPTPWLTIAECLGFVSGTYPNVDGERLREQVAALGLEPALATPLRDASLGQQRKTLLALALALPVKLLLLDEPFNALDAASARHLADTLSARAGRGEQVILLTSHVEPHVPVRDTWVLGS
jgi:ABC-type multidrug transport system ATPase subunit